MFAGDNPIYGVSSSDIIPISVPPNQTKSSKDNYVNVFNTDTLSATKCEGATASPYSEPKPCQTVKPSAGYENVRLENGVEVAVHPAHGDGWSGREPQHGDGWSGREPQPYQNVYSTI